MNAPAWTQACHDLNLDTGLLGLDLPQFPYLSGFGILLRVLRLNCYGREHLHSVFGIRATQTLDLLRACHCSRRDRQRFEAAIGLAGTPIPHYWQEESWCPIQLAGRWNELHLPPRHCPACLRYGYHCSLFQMPFVERCPWHGTTLRDSCVRCGQRYPVRLALHEDVGRCACGYDPFDMHTATANMCGFPTQQALAVLERYWAWCQRERRTRYLVAPEADGVWWSALENLAAPPPDVLPGVRSRHPIQHLWRVAGNRHAEPEPNSFWPWVIIGAKRPLTIAPLPARLHHPLICITRAMVAPLAPTVRTPPQFEDAYSLDAGLLLTDNLKAKPHCFILPFGQKLESGAWLHLSTVPQATLQMCGRLIDAVDQHVAGPSQGTRLMSSEVAKSRALDGVQGRWRLQATLRHLLLRGFAQGLNRVLIQHLGSGLPRRAVSLPVVEFRGSPQQLQGLRTCWIDDLGTPAYPAVARLPPLLAGPERMRSRRRNGRGGRLTA